MTDERSLDWLPFASGQASMLRALFGVDTTRSFSSVGVHEDDWPSLDLATGVNWPVRQVIYCFENPTGGHPAWSGLLLRRRLSLSAGSHQEQ